MKPLTLGAAAPFALMLVSTAAWSIPPAPSIATGQRMLTRWTPGDVRCAGGPVVAIRIRQPAISMDGARPPFALAYRFRIDEQGRPLSVVSDGGARFYAVADDVGASLTASLFAPGPARSDCSIEYRSAATPLDEAEPADLMAYSLLRAQGPLPASAWNRMAGEGATCMTNPRPGPRALVFPDFDAISPTPGTMDWAMVRYDLDARGRPVRPHVVAGSANRALDAASVKAVKASRFTGGARTGCLYPYWRKPATLAAPASPEPGSLQPGDANCPDGREWAIAPRPTYPSAYNRRAIGGWAVIGYDVAPWGETGNVRVLASEPSAAFGQQAAQMIRSARKVASSTGATGCVDKVRFVVDPKDAATEPTPAPPIFVD